MIPAYIRPPGIEIPRPSPVLVIIHGGPAAQYPAGVLVVGELPAGGVGGGAGDAQYPRLDRLRAFLEKLDDGRHREDAVRDLGALLDWISTQPDLDATRVAISGGSTAVTWHWPGWSVTGIGCGRVSISRGSRILSLPEE